MRCSTSSIGDNMVYRTIKFYSTHDFIEAERRLIDKGVRAGEIELDWRTRSIYIETTPEKADLVDRLVEALHGDLV